jgi:NitT/TauT family transport system substrate-binding protein
MLTHKRCRMVPAVASLLGFGLIAAACSSSATSGGGGGSGSLTSVSMGIEPWIGYAPWYIAQKEGYFAKHGLSVNIVNFQQDADRNTALVAGRTNVSNIDTGRTIQFAAKSLPAVPLLLVDDSNGADAIMSVKSISNASQLTGQTIAYEYGTTSDLLLHYYLLQHHMPFSSIKPVNVPAADAGTLLIAGKNKVVVTYQPYISEATSNPNAKNVHVFFSSAQAPGLISDFLVANKSWLAGHAKQARELVQAWSDAIAFYQSHRQQAIDIMAQGIGATPASLAPILSGVILYSVPNNLSLVSSGKLAQEYLAIGQTLHAMGIISHPVPLNSVANFGFLK